MKNIEQLQAAGRLYIYAVTPDTAALLPPRDACLLFLTRFAGVTRHLLPGKTLHSVPRIADQRLAGPEQDHQQDSDRAQHGENRLVEQELVDAVPEPGRMALDPGLERGLAGLVDIVPELAEPGETQGLVGNETGPVIDHKDESAGQEQQ